MDASLVWQIVASVMTMGSMWAYGNKSRWGAIIGIAAEVPWFFLIALHSMWGLIPLNVLTFIVHARNLRKMK